MKRTLIFALLSSLAITFAPEVFAAMTIGANFQGRTSTDPTPATTPLAAGDTAGVVPQQNWNNVDNAYGAGLATFVRANNGTTAPLTDSTGAATTVTLTFAANDSWNNDVDPATITTGNARLMNGVIKQQGAGTAGRFTFNNVPDGQYDVYVYTDSNNDGVALNIADGNYLTTYYTIGTHQFTDTSTFIQAQNTNPAGTRDVGNYVKLSNVATYGASTLGIVATYISGGDGWGIAGIQLVNVGGPVANANPVSILTQPVGAKFAVGDKLNFSVVKKGPGTFQWFKGTTAIAGATNDTYVTPALTASDDGAAFHVVVSNNINNVTSSDAVATLSQITANGFAKEERYDGVLRADVEDPAFAAAPTIIRYLPSFEVPSGQGANFAERVSAIFTPAVSGNYVFFVCSDDDSDLFLSTDATPANKHLIAQETGWSTSRQWTASAGGSDVTAKRSDQFASTEWPAGNAITLTAGTKYYIEAVHHEGGGGDNLAVTFILDTETDPANGAAPKLTGNLISTVAQDQGINITINTQPASVTAQDKKSASFSVNATGTQSDGGTPTIYYQWHTKPPGGANFADIPGATTTSYSTALLSLSDSGTQFRVVLYAPGLSVTSSVATVTVTTDTTPPAVVGATAFPNSTKVGLRFDEALDAASAGNAANYQVNGVAVTSALLRTNVANELTNEKNLVQLTVPTALTTNFTVTVSGVKDAGGNAMTSATVAGKTLNLTSTDIGSPAGEPGGPDPQAPSTVTTWGPGAFDVFTTGSNDYWNNADGFNFVWEPKTNSFDVKVRVVSVSPINNWSAGAIEVREGPPTPNGGGWELARHYFAKVDYGGPDAIQVLDNSGDGADSYEFNRRGARGDPTLRETSNNAPGGSIGWGGTGPGNPSPVPFPNAWIRIARVKSGTNDHLLGYSSSDGVDWSLRQDVDLNDETHAGFLDLDGNPVGKWPDVCYVGLGSTSHTGVGNNNAENLGASTGPFQEFWYSPIGQPYSAYIIYRDYGDVVTPSGAPTLAFQVNADGTVTLTYTGTLYSSDTVNGSFTAVAGATNPYTVNPRTAVKPMTFYISGP